MELLDATIALAVTLAALATTVTVLMEVGVRLLGLKAWYQVRLFRKIFDDAVPDKFVPSTKQKEFLDRVLTNPLVAGAALAVTSGSAANAPDSTTPPEAPSPDTTPPRRAGQLFSWDDFRDFFLWPKRDVSRTGPIPDRDEWTAYFGVGDKGIYEWVSHEHVFRRLLQMKKRAYAERDELIATLMKFTRKYDELCAAASVEFKDNRRRWSVIGGVLLAFAINADGVRIFNEYVKRPELAGAMIAKVDELESVSSDAGARLDEVLDRVPGAATAVRANSEDEGSDDQQLAENVQAVETRIQELRESVDDLRLAGVPIGWNYWPHCVFGLDDKDSVTITESGLCRTQTAGRAAGEGVAEAPSLLGALVAILGTGLLIGLGAPFWFDVARRLAEVRSFFGGKGSSESAYSGDDVDVRKTGKPKAKAQTELIVRVVDEVIAEDDPRAPRLPGGTGEPVG